MSTVLRASAALHTLGATVTCRVTALLQGSRVDVKQVSRVLQLAPRGGAGSGRSDGLAPLFHDKEWGVLQISDGAAAAASSAASAFVAVSRRGAVVLINAEIADALLVLDAVASQAAEGSAAGSSPLQPVVLSSSPAALPSRPAPLAAAVDSLRMVVHPQLQNDCEVAAGVLHVRRLDVDALRTIAAAMEQSILLQRLEQRTDELYLHVKRLIADVASGTFTRGSAATRVMLTANALLGELLLTNVALRPGMPAWSQPPLERMYDALQAELELHTRVDELQRRLTYVTDVAKMCLGGRKDGHLRKLEWMIVAILTLEVLLKLAEVRDEHVDAGAS